MLQFRFLLIKWIHQEVFFGNIRIKLHGTFGHGTSVRQFSVFLKDA